MKANIAASMHRMPMRTSVAAPDGLGAVAGSAVIGKHPKVAGRRGRAVSMPGAVPSTPGRGKVWCLKIHSPELTLSCVVTRVKRGGHV